MNTNVNYFAERLKSNSVKNSIINNIARDFNLTPILAEAYFNQIKDYFTEHVQLNFASGNHCAKQMFVNIKNERNKLKTVFIKPPIFLIG